MSSDFKPLFYVIFKAILWDRRHYPHFWDAKTEAWGNWLSPKFTKLVRSRIGNQIWDCIIPKLFITSSGLFGGNLNITWRRRWITLPADKWESVSACKNASNAQLDVVSYMKADLLMKARKSGWSGEIQVVQEGKRRWAAQWCSHKKGASLSLNELFK